MVNEAIGKRHGRIELRTRIETGETERVLEPRRHRTTLASAVGSSFSATYVTNGRGERVRKNVTAGSTITTTYSYDEGGGLLGEYSVSGAGQAEYVYLDHAPIGVVNGTAFSYIETDHLGTSRQVINPANNSVIWRWEFTANTFGNSTPSQDPDNNGIPFILNLRFAGQYADGEIGLGYNYFRDYEATTGRYVESDPVGLNGGRNTYTYVGSSPLGWIDPFGWFRNSHGNWTPGKPNPGRRKPFPEPSSTTRDPGPDWTMLSPFGLTTLCTLVRCCPADSFDRCPAGTCEILSFAGGYLRSMK